MNFAARIFVGPQVVTCGERTIDVRLQPILFACGLKRNRALHVIQACYARGRVNDLRLRLSLRWVLAWILVLVLRDGGLRQLQKQAGQEREEQCERKLLGHQLDTFPVGTGNNCAILRNQLKAKNHANHRTMCVSDMAADDLHA